MRCLRTLFVVWILAWAGLFSSVAHAKIHLSESLELLVTKADWVVTGRITKLSPADPQARGKNTALTLFLVQAVETVKAPKGQAARTTFCVGEREADVAKLLQHQQQGTELLFFLEQTIQATSYEKVVCDLWPLRNRGSFRPAIVSLAEPGQQLLSATTFKVLKDRAAILAACRDTMKRFPAPEKRSGVEASQPAFVEVPYNSEVYQVLYSGSSCYLYVPDGMFPSARRSF